MSFMNTSNSYGITRYMKRMFNYKRMDFELATWQMMHLFISPKKVYRNIVYQRQTKRQWARDDPAFLVLICIFIFVFAFIVGFGRGQYNLSRCLQMGMFMLILEFLLIGILIATATRTFANTFLISSSEPQHTEDRVEWGYAFDLHCNGFSVLFFYVNILSLVLQTEIFGEWMFNSLYFLGVVGYMYHTFLGYQVLPFIQKPVVFMYPLGIVSLIYLLSIIPPFRFHVRMYSPYGAYKI